MSIKINIFAIIPLIIFFNSCIISQSQSFEPTRNVSVDVEKFKSGPISVYFVCPNVQMKTDFVSYYKIVNGENVLIKYESSPFGMVLKLSNVSALGTYKCSIITDNSIRNAFMNVMDKNMMENPTKFVYNTLETIYVVSREGLVELDCGESGNEHVTWYRPPGFHIHYGNVYRIENINIFHYGAYYCATGSTRNSTVNVKKVILVKEKPNLQEKPINEETTYILNIRTKLKITQYLSHEAENPNDVIVWEQPPGTILLDQGRYLFIPFPTGNQSVYYYRINRNGDLKRNVVGKLLVFPKYQDTLMYIPNTVKIGDTIRLDCSDLPEVKNDAKIIWKKNGILLQRGNAFITIRFEKDSFGKYSCEGPDNVVIKSWNFHTEPKNLASVNMTLDQSNHYFYHFGQKKELHCEIERKNGEWTMKAKDIIWTVNSLIFDKNHPMFDNGISRLNTHSVSILVLTNMTAEHQAAYTCYRGDVPLYAKLIMEPIPVLLELGPVLQTAVDNIHQQAEFHCRIDKKYTNSSSIVWKFIPENKTTEMEIPAEANLENPSLTSSTSFLTFNNVLKRHEGTYVCRVDDAKKFGRLVVRAKIVLVTSPKATTVKPGGTARYMCSLEGIDGEVIWRRKDKQSLTPNKENRLGGHSRTVLEITHAAKEDDGTIYECIFNDLVERVTLNVEVECPLHQRKCKNDTCIDETKFCDGKNDCGDNSDEDRQKCNECSPNSIHCDFLKDSNPTKRCVIKHWKCDGVDDCGNNFDELNCNNTNKDKCTGTHFQCNNDELIPRSYWCDEEIDCKSGEDEIQCSNPQVIKPTKFKKISVFSNSNLTLECQISGRPVPTISWRFNWGHLPENLEYSINDDVSNCSIITSTFTIHNITQDQTGIYSCEGIARRRVMAHDFSVTVLKGLFCKRPYYNHDSWDNNTCIKCYCSGVTDDCTSATGYETNPVLIESRIKASDAAIIDYETFEYYQPAKEITFDDKNNHRYYINSTYYKTLVPDPNYFLGGAFNMAGSWLKRYGYPLKYKIIVSGENLGYLYGPLVMIKGQSNSIYYCRYKNHLRFEKVDGNFSNDIKILLWEQDLWFKNRICTEHVSRGEFMDILKDVRLILFRVKYFRGQTDFGMSKISFQEAMKADDDYSWASKIEKCNCPPNYSGLSCEIKSNP